LISISLQWWGHAVGSKTNLGPTEAKKYPFSPPKSSGVFLGRRFFLARREQRHAMMCIFRAHQFIKGISHCYRPKTASADGINRAIRVRAMEEFTHHQHRSLRSDLNSKYFAVSDFLLTPIDKHLIRQSFQTPVKNFAFSSPLMVQYS
jgi:hypothetical protein